jgi:magnesium transporter
MLNAFICAGGPVRPLAADEPPAELGRAVWIDLLNPTLAEAATVRQATGLTVPTEPEVSEIETSSRLATRDGVLYLSMPLVSIDDEGARGVSAGFVLSTDRLITVRFAPSRIFEAYAATLTANGGERRTGAHILVGLLEAIVDRQADALEQVRGELETISHAIFALGTKRSRGRRNEDATLRRTLGDLGRIGDLTSHIRDTQIGAARVVQYVEGMTADWLPAGLSPRLATLRQDIASVSDFDSHLNGKLQFLLDATLGFINIAQNNVMKVMAIASVVGIPPVLVAGIYGMNFKNMPELDWQWGYAFGWAMVLMSALIPAAVFRWQRWI